MQLVVDNLTFGYGHKTVLNHLSFSLESGNFLTLIGKNGTGKSTLIKCLLKIEKIDDNTVFYDSTDINLIKRFSHVGYVPQKIDFSYEFPITVSEILSSVYNRRKDEYFTAIVNSLNLNPIYRENINTLSGGQIQRIFIARALLNRPKLLILDEPTVGVDTENTDALLKILWKLKNSGVTIIVSTHDHDFAKELTDYTLILSELGEYAFHGGEK
jgi:zinc transport system ATP-binding protein